MSLVPSCFVGFLRVMVQSDVEEDGEISAIGSKSRGSQALEPQDAGQTAWGDRMSQGPALIWEVKWWMS